MNMWGFSASILQELKDRFPKFLDENLEKKTLKCEYFLPFVVDELLGEKSNGKGFEIHGQMVWGNLQRG